MRSEDNLMSTSARDAAGDEKWTPSPTRDAAGDEEWGQSCTDERGLEPPGGKDAAVDGSCPSTGCARMTTIEDAIESR